MTTTAAQRRAINDAADRIIANLSDNQVFDNESKLVQQLANTYQISESRARHAIRKAVMTRRGRDRRRKQ